MSIRAVAAAALVLVAAACAPDPLPGYRAATADERASIVATISEYYDIVNRAVVSGDITPLYVRHPGLARPAAPGHGINNEAATARLPSVSEGRVREVHVDFEWYEPVRAFVKDGRAVAYSHGLFTWTYTTGGADTKGELAVRFDMIRAGDGWSIDQTDEWVLGEGTPPPTPRR